MRWCGQKETASDYTTRSQHENRYRRRRHSRLARRIADGLADMAPEDLIASLNAVGKYCTKYLRSLPNLWIMCNRSLEKALQRTNVYPIYDWRTEDIWAWQGKNPDRRYNKLYDLMHKAGLTIHQQRICQPYGDDQRRGLWLFHLIEPETWSRVVARVNGANGGALYAGESGNVTGYRKVSKPERAYLAQFRRTPVVIDARHDERTLRKQDPALPQMVDRERLPGRHP